MANYSDITTMFNIRHWFEFENGSDLGLDTITGTSLLSTAGPLSLLGFREDPDYPGFPTVGQSLYIDDTDDFSYRTALIKITNIIAVLATGTDSISFTAMFNHIHNEPAGSPPPVDPPGSPIPDPPGTPPTRSYFDSNNPRLKMNGLIDKPETRDLNPPTEPAPVLPGQNPCFPPYDHCFPVIDPNNGGCGSTASGLRVKPSANSDVSFLTDQYCEWNVTGNTFELTEDFNSSHPGEFHWDWGDPWHDEISDNIDSFPIIQESTSNAKTRLSFGYNGAPITLDFELIDLNKLHSHYAGTTIYCDEQIFEICSVSEATTLGFQNASMSIVNTGIDSDNISTASIAVGWRAWLEIDGEDRIIKEQYIYNGVADPEVIVSSSIKGVFKWELDDGYINSSDLYNTQGIDRWTGTDWEIKRFDMRNRKMVVHIDRGSNTSTNADPQVEWCPMGCVRDGPLEIPTPDMALFNIKTSNDDVNIIVESNTLGSYLAILNNDIYLADLIILNLENVFTLTASIDIEKEYPDSEYTYKWIYDSYIDNDPGDHLIEETKTFTIANAEYLLVTIKSSKESFEHIVVDVYDSNDSIVHSCREYHDMDDTVKVIGNTAKITVYGGVSNTNISIVDQDGNRGSIVKKPMLSVYLDGAIVLKTQLQSSITGLSDFILTDQRSIEPAGSPLPMDPFRGTIAEFIISDHLKPNEAFRLHNILNGLFSTETMEDLDSLYGSMFWYKFVNGKNVGTDAIDSFLAYDEIHNVNSALVYPLKYYANSEDYDFSISCPKAFYMINTTDTYRDYDYLPDYYLKIDKEGYTKTQEMIDVSDLMQTHYSTVLIHINPHDIYLPLYDGWEHEGEEVYGYIFHMGDNEPNSDAEYFGITVGRLNNTVSLTNLELLASTDPIPVISNVVPIGKPFVLYVGIDAISLTVAIDGNIVYSQPRPTEPDWEYILNSPISLGLERDMGWETSLAGTPPLYVSDYIQHKGPLDEKKLKKISSIYHAGDTSYSQMVGQIPTIENVHHMIKTNHRMNLSEAENRGMDLVTGKRIPVTFTGSRYAKIPGHPHIEGVVLDGQPNKRSCTISHIYSDGYFNTGVDKNSYVRDDDTLHQIISVGTFIYHDDLKKFNLLRWTGAKNPAGNWIEIVVSSRGIIAYQMSIDGYELTVQLHNSESNFGLNSFFLHFSLFTRQDEYLYMKTDIHFGDQVKTVTFNESILNFGFTMEEYLEDIVAGSTLEIGGGKNINTYMDSDYNLSGIISDIIFFSDSWTSIDNPVSLYRTIKDNPPGAIGLEKGHGGLGKGSGGSGLMSVNSHNGIEPGVDPMPLTGTAAALLISETNDYNSPVLTMRPIIDVKVSDGFAGAPYTDTYLVPIPSCSGVDLSIFKLAVTDPFKEEGSRLSISDHSSDSNYYWHRYSKENREYGRRGEWSNMRIYNEHILEEGPFCEREGLVYDFIKYNGKIAFSFLARYLETNKDVAYGDKELNHHNEYRGKRLYHYNHVGYFDQSLMGEIKWSYKYADDGSNGIFGLLRCNKNNGFIHLAANNQPHSFIMSTFQTRLDAAQNYDELCQHQRFRCNEGHDDGYGGDYGGEY